MSLEPKLAEKLMSEVPEMRVFCAFIAGEILNLDKVSDIKPETIESGYGIEVRARQLAILKLKDILSPLIDRPQVKNSPSAKEYDVVV